MFVEPFSTAPLSSCRFTPGLRKIAPDKNSPLGITSVPPRFVTSASIAFWMAAVLSVTPSPTAPVSTMDNCFAAVALGHCFAVAVALEIKKASIAGRMTRPQSRCEKDLDSMDTRFLLAFSHDCRVRTRVQLWCLKPRIPHPVPQFPIRKAIEQHHLTRPLQPH